MRQPEAADPDRLLSDVEWAIAHGLEADDLVPMLEKLVRSAEPGSAARLFGVRHLAELLVAETPWRAALLAREVLAARNDDRAWAVLGLAHTFLGHYRAAASAYRRALALAPNCPWYLHNLGHVVDVALNCPRDALGLLARAHAGEPDEVEIAASYAHALARADRRAEALRVLIRATGRDTARCEVMIDTWLLSDPPGSGHVPA